MLLGPELADGARSMRSPRCRPREDDPSIDAEPGKILHELRRGRAGRDLVPHLLRHASTRRRSSSSCSRRSGAGPATPRSSERLREPALAALALDRRVRRPRRRRVRRVRAPDAARAREPVVEGLRRLAALPRRHASRATPIAPAEVQGYVYDAKLRMAELARAVWRRRRRSPRGSSARRPSCSAASTSVLGRGARRLLRARARRRQAARRLALLEHRPPALERDRPAGARRRDRAPADGRRALVGLGDPHDVDRGRRLQPAQLPQRHRLAPRHVARRLGPVRAAAMPDDVDRIARTLLEAARFFDWSLPEVFAGFAATETPFPIAYPTAARPQAWAAGTPVLLLRLLLGLEPDPHSGAAPHRGDGRTRVAGRARAQRRPRVRALVAHRRCGRSASARRLHEMKSRRPQPGLVPRAAVRLRRDRVDRRRCSRTASPTRATT